MTLRQVGSILACLSPKRRRPSENPD